MAINEEDFRKRGINLCWSDIHEGTGKMCQLLQNEETDLAIILTEGIVKSITEGNPVKIVQEYIATPLLWGLHVASKSQYQCINDLIGTKAAISRYGSGSHLMAYVNAKNQEWDANNLQFEVVNNLNGAVKALTKGQADYFLWEHFTTKPIVDQGVFRRLGDCPTSWPCFVIAATDRFIKENSGLLKHILEVINRYTSEFKSIPSIDRTLANGYQQRLEDIQKWLSMTRWSQQQIDADVLKKVSTTLLQLNLIDRVSSIEDLALSP
ncbi:FIG00930805: hypothetical protein [hydrothermal vent metagenome]|uniref:Ca3427-like PBP 2 domain-containing protein n=1 Tax=hydrothermal vent metagenome TaxID=652676 RepID=A0A3B0TF05_9ZZZZ